MNVQLIGRHDLVRATPAARSTILDVEDLHVSFPGRLGRREVVRGISFTIGAGEILAIVGESGSGLSLIHIWMCIRDSCGIDQFNQTAAP